MNEKTIRARGGRFGSPRTRKTSGSSLSGWASDPERRRWT